MFKEKSSPVVRQEDDSNAPALAQETETSLFNAINDDADVTQFIQHMPDLVCLSHLRWDFVYQRPQHLLSRFAQHGRVFFVEEPIFGHIDKPFLDTSSRADKLTVVVPRLPHGLQPEQVEQVQRILLNDFLKEKAISRYMLWYYTPMALGFTNHLAPLLTVYDCMDELSAFNFAPPRLQELESELFQRADLVFTGGQSLYEAKREKHPAVYAFPSSIDKAHFAQAQQPQAQPADQATIPSPRMGFFGVIDERLDIDLLRALATARPDWQVVIIGPVVKIDPASLPQLPNIHYLGGKSYQELPAYLSGWDVALLPFAINASTAFISPTKTPEYLAAGKPVVSTPIRDVVRPYGDAGLVHIAASELNFVTAVELALAQKEDIAWSQKVTAFLSDMSWDTTWQQMAKQMARVGKQKVK